MFLEELAEPKLVHRVGDRPEQADGDRLDLAVSQLLDLGHGRLLVERNHDLASCTDALGDLERQRPGYVGIRVRAGEVERLGPAAFTEEEDVRMALGGEERRLRRGPGEDRVDRPGRPVDEKVGVGQKRAAIGLRGLRGEVQDVEDARDRICGRRRALEDRELAGPVLHDQIREGPAGVDCKPHGCLADACREVLMLGSHCGSAEEKASTTQSSIASSRPSTCSSVVGRPIENCPRGATT